VFSEGSLEKSREAKEVRKKTEKFGRGLRGILVKKGYKRGGVSL